jgi:hypothetical protein
MITTVGCPLSCKLCPQDSFLTNYKDPKRILLFEDFKMVLGKIPKFLRIDFAGFSEPWLNKNCTNMLEYALNSGFNITIFSTLYQMTEEDADRIANLIIKFTPQVKQFFIHLPDSAGNMPGWRYSKTYENVLLKFLSLPDNIKKEIQFRIVVMVHKNSPNPLHPDLSHISLDSKEYKQFHNDWNGHTRAGNVNRTKELEPFIAETPKNQFALTCASTIFYDHNTMLPNGDVLLCCMDFGVKHIIGNLFTQNYEDLYLSEEMVKVMRINKSREYSSGSLCKSCTNVTPYKIYPDVHWRPGK